MWGYELRALGGPNTGFGITQTIAWSLDQACSDTNDPQFALWVRQQPPLMPPR
jgi:hypothetical protein